PFWTREPAAAPSHTPCSSSPSHCMSWRQCGVCGYLKYCTRTLGLLTPSGYGSGDGQPTLVSMTTIGSRYVDIDGPVHVADLGGEGPPVVCVHGLGGSYVNWLAPGGLQDLGRVTAIDLPGFGLTPPAGRASSVAANQRILDRYLRSFGQPVTLVGNSMGGAIAIRQAARAPDTVARLILVSPAAPWDFFEAPPDPVVAAFFFAYAVPGLATAVMKWRRHFMDPEEVARMVIDLCTPHPERIDAE